MQKLDGLIGLLDEIVEIDEQSWNFKVKEFIGRNEALALMIDFNGVITHYSSITDSIISFMNSEKMGCKGG